jgi:hypothetical protein
VKTTHLCAFALLALVAVAVGCGTTPTTSSSEPLGTTQAAYTQPPVTGIPAHVVSYGGRESNNTMVVPVYWTANVWGTVQNQMSNFYNTLYNSSWLQPLQTEYVWSVQFAAAVTIIPNTQKTTLTVADIATELAWQLSHGNLPNSSTFSYVYAVHLPPGVTGLDPIGNPMCGVAAGCAYHNAVYANDTNHAFLVIPDYSPSGQCASNWCAGQRTLTAYQAMTVAETHEIVEAASDPDVSTGFKVRSSVDQGINEEIGDLCQPYFQPITSSYGTFYVQSYWSNRANGCVAGPAAAGDVDGDGLSDLTLTGGTNWQTVPVAFSQGDGTFYGTNAGIAQGDTNFPSYAAQAGVQPIGGDFDGDGHTDIALVGVSGGTMPVAHGCANQANCRDGTWRATSGTDNGFHTYLQPGAVPVAGDFNGDGYTDIALVGVSSWTSIPIAMSNGYDGSFTLQLINDGGFHVYYQSGFQAVPGDYNCDGMADIALVGPTSWQTIPVAYSPPPGKPQVFSVTNDTDDGLHAYYQAGIRAVALPSCAIAGIGLVGPSSWTVFPVSWEDYPAYGFGPFAFSAGSDMGFHAYYQPGFQVGTGDYNGDGLYDIALAGGNNWHTMPVGYTFWFLGESINKVTNYGETAGPDRGFATYAAQPGAKLVTAPR